MRMLPVLENRGKESKVYPHFRKAPYFTLYDSETKKLEIERSM